MLEAIALCCTRGERSLFADLSFGLPQGIALRVRGENGSGKTSLLRILAGLAPAAGGEVRWKGALLCDLGEDYLSQIVFIGHANALKDDLSAVENLRYGLALSGIAVAEAACRAALAEDGLGRIADLPVQWLSQGQKRRTALTRLAFCRSRPLWILDEPFSALDGSAVSRLAERLQRHLGDGGMVVFTTHQEVPLGFVTQGLELQ
ncbi:MAG TPA: cytochrome c biogenesis heme-transporting ATPase CcmA [Burkholderiales bacterium]|nr:cytochrome c biogenesis heme-transporting ATPase CcmA [Burkholderiales bacterium]